MLVLRHENAVLWHRLRGLRYEPGGSAMAGGAVAIDPRRHWAEWSNLVEKTLNELVQLREMHCRAQLISSFIAKTSSTPIRHNSSL
ncbi:hypothetical protein [Nonomuraea sp. NPDC049480]|uniref:hypothetical protein n=1 Tax=Nonomuraea sp. NPDC049480 TaxID=3364353 RepID=UPI003790C48C